MSDESQPEKRNVLGGPVTTEFLAHAKTRGNDLSTPRPEFGFPGLMPGDRWCLCAQRWNEAEQAGVAPPVILEACDQAALKVVALETLRQYAIKAVH